MTPRRAAARGIPVIVTPAPRPAPRRPGLVPSDVADALTDVLTKATAAIRDNEAGSRSGGDIEHVHQMRVATRRIRAYLKAAKPALDADAAGSLRRELSGLAATLGAVRDLDVMIERLHTEAAALDGDDGPALERLTAQLNSERNQQRVRLVAALDDPSFGGLLDDLDAAAARPPVADPWVDLRALAALEYATLARARHALAKKFADDPPDDDLHALRILGKRARYSAELLTTRATKRSAAAVKRFLVSLADFQELLGTHQDACVLEDQLRVLIGRTADAAAAIASGRVIAGCRVRRAEVRAQYPAAWDAVEAAAAAAFA